MSVAEVDPAYTPLGPTTKLNKLDVDPLAVACYMYDNGLTNYTDMFNQGTFKDVGSVAVLSVVVSKPRFTKWADNIREYYGKKFMMMSIKKQTLTRFRKELFEFLNMDKGTYLNDHIGMLAVLPRMFEEDTILEDLRDSFNNSPWKESENNGKTAEIDLTYIDSHLKKGFKHDRRVNNEWLCYWCHDENDRLYMIEFDMDNPFRNYWQKTIEHTFRIKGTPIQHNAKDDVRYYTLVDWQIL